MSSTSFITLPMLIKLWILAVALYTARSAASDLQMTPQAQVALYAILTVMIYSGSGILGSMIQGGSRGGGGGGGGHGTGSGTDMNREESELVKEYIRYRRQGETLGAYLARVEGEEEDMMEGFGHGSAREGGGSVHGGGGVGGRGETKVKTRKQHRRSTGKTPRKT